MPDGKHCPACGKDIGLWPIVSAGLPNRIRCPHCRARLCFADSTPVTVVVLIIGVVLVGGIYLGIHLLTNWSETEKFFWWVLITLPLWTAVEFVVARHLRNAKVLQSLDPLPDNDEVDEQGDL